MAIVKKETVHGTEVTFEVDSHGKFHVDLGEYGQVVARTLSEVEEKVAKILKRKKAMKPVPVTVLGIKFGPLAYGGGNGYQRGREAMDFILRGYADRTSDVLMATADGSTKFKLDASPFARQIVKRMTSDQHQTYRELQAAIQKAQDELAEFEALLEPVDPRKLAENA